MKDLEKRLSVLKEDFLKVWERLTIDEKLKQLSSLEKEVADPDIWRDVEKATEKNQELARLQEEVQPWELLKTQITDLSELIEITDDSLEEEINGQVEERF